MDGNMTDDMEEEEGIALVSHISYCVYAIKGDV